MTVTDARWWAPTEPGIGPDEFDLELLEPGEDSAADLGQAFLALHRVGAAACEAVATQPLADESALAFALANARRLVAPEASQIVSKSVGDNVNYGNLLIRDVLDDAEATALSLWRSCVAKSVPASVTAQRVGMVYGIPPGELYVFQKLATDPKAQPAALQEAADKALFTHVAKLVAEEAVERKVEISKQRPPRAARARWWDEEPRDASGEWTESPERLGDVEPVEPERVPTRARRAQRAQRARRVQRVEPDRQVGAEATHEAGRDVGVDVGRHAGVLADRQAGGKVAELLGGRPANPNFDPGNKTRVPREVPDATKPYLATEHGEYIDKQLSFVLPSDEWQAFMQGAAPSDLGKMFYAGRLQEYVGLPTVYQDEGELTTFEHEQMVKQVADKIKQDAAIKAQPAPRTLFIRVDRDTTEAEIDAKIKRWMTREIGLGDEEFQREEAFVEVFGDVSDPKAMYVVYTPKPRNRPRDADRPLPQLTEVVVADEDLFGDYQERGGKGQYRIDRSQMLTTSGVFARKDVVGRRFWDQDNQIVRNVVYTHVTDETVQKAMGPERFHELEEQGRVHRDEQGEFAPTEEVTAPRARRAQRAQRARRQQLVARPVEQDAERSVGRDVSRSAARDVFREVRPTKTPGSKTGDGFTLAMDDYTVVPHWVMLNPGFSHPAIPNAKARAAIAEAGVEDDQDAETSAGTEHAVRHTLKGPARNEERVTTYHGARVEDLESIAFKINQMMNRQPPRGEPFFTLARIHLQLNDDDTADIEVFRNTENLGPREVIRWGDVSPNERYELVPERAGRFWTPRMTRHWLHGSWASAEKVGKETGNYEDSDYLADPWVQVWRAEPIGRD